MVALGLVALPSAALAASVQISGSELQYRATSVARKRLSSCRRPRVRIVVTSRDAKGRPRTVTRKAILRTARGAAKTTRRHVCS